MSTKKTRTYPWAVVNESGRLMREENDRRAIYRTREQARMSARVLKGRPVRRDEVVTTTTSDSSTRTGSFGRRFSLDDLLSF